MSDDKSKRKQILEVSRNNSYIGLTWQLFINYLGDFRDDPRKSLEKAMEAAEVWKDFEDSQHMDYPEEVMEIDTQHGSGTLAPFNFIEAMREAAPIIAEAMMKVKARRNSVEEEMIASSDSSLVKDEDEILEKGEVKKDDKYEK